MSRETRFLSLGHRGVAVTRVGRDRSVRGGTRLIAVDSPEGLLLMSRDDARELIREQLAGNDVVSELLAERAREASRESRVA